MAEQAKTPVMDVFTVTERKDRDNFWLKVGGAFEFTTKTGEKGLNIVLHAAPLTGKLTLLPYKPPRTEE